MKKTRRDAIKNIVQKQVFMLNKRTYSSFQILILLSGEKRTTRYLGSNLCDPPLDGVPCSEAFKLFPPPNVLGEDA